MNPGVLVCLRHSEPLPWGPLLCLGPPQMRTTGTVTQQVAREVDRQDDAQGQEADHHQQEDDMSLEGQVVDGILPTPLQDLVITGQDTHMNHNE